MDKQKPLNGLPRNLTNPHKVLIIIFSIFSVIILGFFDYISGNEISFSIFYLLPITAVAWAFGVNTYIFFSLYCSIALFLAEYLGGRRYSHFMILIWNTIMRLMLFLIVSWLVNRTKKMLLKQEELSLTDPLTNMFNARYFYQQSALELEKARRYKYPFTLCYIDLDNFKKVNDTYGHKSGDDLLKIISETIKASVRSTDIAARMGGDEFIILFINTKRNAAEKILKTLQSKLEKALEENFGNVTFSIGGVSCGDGNCEIEEIIREADELMYQVKSSGKNNIKFKKKLPRQDPAAWTK